MKTERQTNWQDANPCPVIRPATQADLPKLHEMIGALAARHGDTATVSIAELDGHLSRPNTPFAFLIAEIEGQTVGYCAVSQQIALHLSEKSLRIDHLYVCLSHRGKKIGWHLVQSVVTQAKSLGCVRCVVGARRENLRAQNFYLNAGFQRRIILAEEFVMLPDA